MRTKHTFRLPPDLAGQLADHANRKRVPQALIVETALASFLSPDNSERMEAALRHLAERGAGHRLVAILGGMAELGDYTERHHREIAEVAEELGIEVIAVGEVARAYGADAWVPDADAALAAARALIEPGDAVLVKASRSIALEGIAPALANPTA